MFSRLFSAFKPAAPTVLLGPATQPTTTTALNAQQSIRTMATNGSAGKEDFGTFALGCFWGSEHMYRKYYTGKGLLDAKVGYIGGKDSSKNPSYQEVCSGRTGHAEAVLVKFDPSQVTYAELVEFFYRIHDPTTKDRQGADRGTQYRSAIFPHNPEQVSVAKKVTEEVQEKHFTPSGKKIVTTIEERPVGAFFEGEDYHQRYLEMNPSGYECPNHRLWW
ncbi:methionine sulfoxide reductase A [Microstroma glucosiphilum]|uniref:peptide-methionine (S)-S-oxide reductase n=1 Tax=Pseudomicrostroma glucosiphilum TaxID=1684307 RepID=A0A316UC89_9BASI|nr:methionine sulfoxide reductase A [Pseudomicrostroma glucosiphilum]PWN22806.1 methionine sulfoxide reductase A [Pseudomicrostroma glucosiphilum]